MRSTKTNKKIIRWRKENVYIKKKKKKERKKTEGRKKKIKINKKNKK